MKRTTRRRFTVLALIAMMAGGATPLLAQKPVAPPPAEKRHVVVFAAASLKTALDAIAASFKQNTGNELSITYASSAVLAKEIAQGARADVFFSADLAWMDYLDKVQLIRPWTRRNLLGNKLVLVEAEDRETKLEIVKGFDIAGATGDGKIAVCTIASCPGGIYAKEALEALEVWTVVQSKLAQAENIRAALALVSRGGARYGIVYATDAKADPKVRIVGTFPDASHEPIIYPVALVASSTNPVAAEVVSYLSSQAATKILLAQGFSILSR